MEKETSGVEAVTHHQQTVLPLRLLPTTQAPCLRVESEKERWPLRQCKGC